MAETVMNYIKGNENNFGKLKRKLIENEKIFQYVYASIYPEVYSFVEKRGVHMRNNFHLKFKEWKNRKKIFSKIDWWILFQATKFTTTQGCGLEKTCYGWGLWGRKKIVEEQKQK